MILQSKFLNKILYDIPFYVGWPDSSSRMFIDFEKDIWALSWNT